MPHETRFPIRHGLTRVGFGSRVGLLGPVGRSARPSPMSDDKLPDSRHRWFSSSSSIRSSPSRWRGRLRSPTTQTQAAGDPPGRWGGGALWRRRRAGDSSRTTFRVGSPHPTTFLAPASLSDATRGCRRRRNPSGKVLTFENGDHSGCRRSKNC